MDPDPDLEKSRIRLGYGKITKPDKVLKKHESGSGFRTKNTNPDPVLEEEDSFHLASFVSSEKNFGI